MSIFAIISIARVFVKNEITDLKKKAKKLWVARSFLRTDNSVILILARYKAQLHIEEHCKHTSESLRVTDFKIAKHIGCTWFNARDNNALWRNKVHTLAQQPWMHRRVTFALLRDTTQICKKISPYCLKIHNKYLQHVKKMSNIYTVRKTPDKVSQVILAGTLSEFLGNFLVYMK